MKLKEKTTRFNIDFNNIFFKNDNESKGGNLVRYFLLM